MHACLRPDSASKIKVLSEDLWGSDHLPCLLCRATSIGGLLGVPRLYKCLALGLSNKPFKYLYKVNLRGISIIGGGVDPLSENPIKEKCSNQRILNLKVYLIIYKGHCALNSVW